MSRPDPFFVTYALPRAVTHGVDLQVEALLHITRHPDQGAIMTMAPPGAPSSENVVTFLSEDARRNVVQDLYREGDLNGAYTLDMAKAPDAPTQMLPGQVYQTAAGLALVAMTDERLAKAQTQAAALIDLLRVVGHVANGLEAMSGQLQGLIKLGNGAENNRIAFDLREANDQAVEMLREALAAVGKLGD